MNIKKHPVIFTLNILIFFLAILFFYTDSFSISIKGTSVLLVLPILTAYSVFHSPLRSGVTGLICGVFMDACMVGSVCFNAIILFCIGVLVSVISNNLFNKNIQSATVLSLITSSIYFVFLWLVFHTANVSLSDNFMYLFNYAFPSAIFTAVFIFPFYYLYKHFNKLQMD
ncbi:MAG: hypothetical protein E7537_01445 [Ruminococcaceae bacterium]|nr:hypothetical protein [Oscillospiraceae bacterium]